MLRLTKGSRKRLYSLKSWSPSLISKRPNKEDASWDIRKGLITLPAGVPLHNAPSPEYWDAFYSCGHYGSSPRLAGDYSSFVVYPVRPPPHLFYLLHMETLPVFSNLYQLWFSGTRRCAVGEMEDSYILKPCKIQNVHFYEAMLYSIIFKTPTVPCGILEPVQLSKD